MGRCILKIIGIDPGNKGAIAVLDDGVLTEVYDMPTTQIVVGGKNRNQILPALVADLFFLIKPHFVMLEQVGTRPGEGAVGAFTFGRGLGVLEGVIASHGIASSYVTPAVWKKALRLSAEKSVSRLMAIRLFPALADKFRLVKDDGRAEAALIAYYAYRIAHNG